MDKPSLYTILLFFKKKLNEYHADFCDFFCCCFFDYIRRARKKRVSEDSDEDDEAGTAGDDSDVEMADANAHRKSDASEPEKQTRASRLSARTRAKVCCVASGTRIELIFCFFWDAGETF